MLLSPNLSTEQLTAFKAKVDGILAKGEAQIVRFEERGRQKLAYPVKKELFGYYILYDYRSKAELAFELERNLKIDEQVFKYLTIVLDKNFTEEKYQAVLDNMASEAAKKEKEKEQAQEKSAKAPELGMDDELMGDPFGEESSYFEEASDDDSVDGTY
jgi:small subunit ribosomal protein S6